MKYLILPVSCHVQRVLVQQLNFSFACARWEHNHAGCQPAERMQRADVNAEDICLRDCRHVVVTTNGAAQVLA